MTPFAESGDGTAAGEACGRVAIFAPSPVLTVTIEAEAQGAEIHLHAGGQGFWAARLASALGADVALCCALGGESGEVLRALIQAAPLQLRATEADGANGVYIHDRRDGERQEVARTAGAPLTRHAIDELYGMTLTSGMDADVTLITGHDPEELLDGDVYRRVVSDLRSNGRMVIADLTGAPLQGVLDAGIDLIKIAADELVEEGHAADESREELGAGARELLETGAEHVLVTRADEPALLFGPAAEGGALALTPPLFEALDHRGAGDSTFAATGVGLARGLDLVPAVRLGMAAGALNATRRGLGSGTREEIEQLARHVTVEPLSG